MAVPKTLASILKDHTKSLLLLRHFTVASASSSSWSPSSPISFSLRLTSSYSRLFSPTWGRISSSSGPLFLSSPPWMLLQSATPLYLQGEVARQVKEGVFPQRFDFRRERTERGEGKRSGEGRDGGAVVGDRILNLPNLISISRLVSGPGIGWMIINEWYLPSFVALAISGMTDWLDGYAARKMNINSVLGSYLDPLADKVLIACVAVAMVKKDLLHLGLVQLVVLRDVGLVSGAIYKRATTLDWKWKNWSEFVSLNTSRPIKVKPLFISKVNTVFQLILVASALLQPEFGTEETQAYITYLSWLVASTTVGSSLAYGVQHFCKRAPFVGVR